MLYYLADTLGILLACDSTRSATLFFLEEYVKILTIYLDLGHLPMLLISTKHDLPANLTLADIQRFTQQHMIHEYFPTSSVTGLNIDTAFQHMTQLIAE